MVARTSSHDELLSAVLKLAMFADECILRATCWGLDLTLPSLGDRKVMKWSLMSSMMDPLNIAGALLLVMMWSMSVDELPWMRVAFRLVSVNPLSVKVLK